MKFITRSLTAFALIASSTGLSLEVGDMAPDFSLQGSDGKTYSLEQYKGKQAIVMAWYPMAFTRGCTIECKSLAENGHLLKQFDVSYFMASVDSLEKNTAFAESTKADFPLLSDPTKTTAKAYDVLALYGFPKRHTIYIGKDGKILMVDRKINAATSAQDIAANLEKLGIPRIALSSTE
ncbi:MAG: peroxiredoxin [Porticoccaceae bacterium]